MKRQSTSLALLALLSAAASATACGSAEDPSAGYEATASDEELASGTIETGASGDEDPKANSGAFAPTTETLATMSSSFDLTGAPVPPLVDPAAPPSLERQVVAKLGLGASFLIGLGNDASTTKPDDTHTYALEQKLDIHYMYLSGLGWPEWNLPAGNYVTLHANAAKARGIVPMFTLYQAAAYGENNLGVFDTTAFMTKYWRGVRLMFQHLAAFDAPAVVHVEPDLWGYAQRHSELPSGTPMKVGAVVPECADLPSDVSGMARCVIRLSRQIAPKVVIGLSASSFGAFTNGYSDPTRIASYMKSIGADEGDITVIETLDRDAGCFEKGSDPNCKRSGQFYWDESNGTHPNFHDHLAWAKAIRAGIGKPLLWWQMPLGVPAGTSGAAGRYRDNRVRYLFSHTAEFASVGGIGAVFGTGAGNQTDATTDGGQFANAVTSYYAAPAALP